MLFLTIDGTNYPVDGSGVTVTNVAAIHIQPVVGSNTPRITVGFQYAKIDALLPENTLASLQLAWNQPGSNLLSVSWGQQLYLGVITSLPVHTLGFTGQVYNPLKQRRYYFNTVCSMEHKPQAHDPAKLTAIPVSFYAYADETQAAGRELGRAEQDY